MTGVTQAVFMNQRSFVSAPVNTVAPVVSGTATVRQTLSTTNGTWTGIPTPTFTYQWFRSPSTSISGATSSTYTLVDADVSNTIFCRVTGTNVVAAVNANSNTTSSVAAAVPGAPTIGTATATGSTTATVNFTAPASNGGATITLYTAIDQNSTTRGTLAQAGSGTINLTGLTDSTNYTFRVFATNSVGNSANSAASNQITTTPTVGAAYGGGFFAGQISTAGNGVASHNLVIAPVASGQSIKQWMTSNDVSFGASSVIDGPTNSANMNSATFPAAQFCEGLTIGGFSDWYMPAKNELEVCYYNLKPTTTSNNTGSGTNTNAVPSRGSNYTSGTPAQTSAASFQSGGAEAFVADYYWSSTEFYPIRGWIQRFSNGYQIYYTKSSNLRVRAVRRVAV